MTELSGTRSAAEIAAWDRIRRHPVGGDGNAAFVLRLQREQGWTPGEAQQAMEEYRRFCFLAITASHVVTPSEEVDAVWHLHLLHTQDYWIHFCREVLGTDLHHGPTRGASEEARYRELYAQTLQSYEHAFGPPSPRWWPGTRQRFARKQAVLRIDPKRYWVVPRPRWPQYLRARLALRLSTSLIALAAVATPRVADSARPGNPLDWSGGDFLQLFLAAMAICLVGTLLLRAFLRSRMAPAPRNIGALSVWESAWLAGGAERVVDAGVAELHRLGKLGVETDGKLKVLDSRTTLEPPLDGILASAGASGQVRTTLRDASARLQSIRSSLERRGLWFEPDPARRISTLSALPWLVLTVFGAAKVWIGIERDRPVLFLVILCVVCAVFALGMYFSRAGRTPAGKQELKRLNRMHATTRRAPRSEQVALAVALAGTSVLAGTALASYHTARHPPSSSDSSSGSDSGGDSGGSSGCGGCGGGD